MLCAYQFDAIKYTHLTKNVEPEFKLEDSTASLENVGMEEQITWYNKKQI